jgi:hypothetical protein
MSVQDDLESYFSGMMNNDYMRCLSIEKRYGLDGYPPQVVTTWMSAEIREPGSGNATIDRLLGNEEEDQ